MFRMEDMRELLDGRRLLLIGASNTRALYKDLVWLFQNNTLIPGDALRRKLEYSFLGDILVQRSKLHKGRDFVEHRYFEKDNTSIEYRFVTRCYNSQIVGIFKDIKEGRVDVPDVVYLCSCIWDITRWGPSGFADYKKNLVLLMKLLDESLPKSTLVIWGTATPPGPTMKGGLIIKQIEFMQSTARVEMMEANCYVRDVVASCGFDVLDYHFYLHMQVFRRRPDGVHFGPMIMRFMSNLLLTHIAASWDFCLPQNAEIVLLKDVCDKASSGSTPPVGGLVQLEKIASQLQSPAKAPQSKAAKKNQKNTQMWATRAQTRAAKRQFKNVPVRRNQGFHPYRR